MGDVIKRKLAKYHRISVILVLLLCLDIIFVISIQGDTSKEERKIRVEINHLVQALSDQDDDSITSEIQKINEPIAFFDISGKVLLSTMKEYEEGQIVDLETLGQCDSYMVPIQRDGKVSGLLLIDITNFRNYSMKNWKLLQIWIPILLVILLFMVYYKREKVMKEDLWNPIGMLHESTKSILQGDYSKSVNYDYGGEMGLLCHDFEKMRDELRDAKKREELSSEKERVLYASISHDLKTPIAIVNGYLEQIKYGIIKEPDEIQEAINHVLGKTKVTNQLIDDILEHSKAQLNQLSIQKQCIYSKDYFTKMCEEYCSEAEQCHYQFTYGMIPQLMLEIDAGRIGQVLQNIIGNSVKYSKENLKIEMKFDVMQMENGRILIVSIHDNGPGIDAKDLPFVFDLFYRGDKARTQNVPGSGLGLNISQYIIHQHGGEIECDSIAGDGTTISFSLPIL